MVPFLPFVTTVCVFLVGQELSFSEYLCPRSRSLGGASRRHLRRTTWIRLRSHNRSAEVLAVPKRLGRVGVGHSRQL
jgi:hypothetical protein